MQLTQITFIQTIHDCYQDMLSTFSGIYVKTYFPSLFTCRDKFQLFKKNTVDNDSR